MAWTEQDYQEIVARLMANSIGVNEVPNADKADDVTSLPAFKPSGSNSEASVVNYPLEFLKGEQGEPGIQGEPGKPFKVAGEYDTLEALKSAVPDGSAVDGFMAVGTEAPYDYYAWVSSAGGNNPDPSPDGKYLLLSDDTPLLLANEEPILLADNGERVASNGEWVNQGKIGGIEEAPTDGKAYGRKNGDWAEVSDKKYVDDSISSARSVGYMMQLTEIDASGLDENTWYPVIIKLDTLNFYRIEVHATLGMTGSPSWAEHDEGFVTHKIWEVNAEGYGTAQIVRNIFISTYGFANIDPVRGIGQLTRNSFEYVYVRGGGKYQFYTSHKLNIQLITSRLEVGYEEVIEPTTETPAEIVANIATKKYVDSYFNIVKISSEASLQLITNQFVKGEEVESKINFIFQSVENFKAIVTSLLKDNLLFFTVSENESFKINTSHIYCNPNSGAYELSFILTYTGIANVDVINVFTKRVFIALNATKTNFFIVQDLVQSDNLITLTKKTAAEYKAIGSKDANTAYCVTD